MNQPPTVACADKPPQAAVNRRKPLATLFAWFFLLAAARLLARFPFPLPKCGFRSLTGLPCPLCGSTHCLIAISNFEVSRAFHFNPLVVVAAMAWTGWLALWLIDCWRGRDMAAGLWERLQTRSWLLAGAGAILANWIYLLVYLPK